VVINPLVSCKEEKDRREMIKTYSEIMQGNRLDIWLKHQNTQDFLEFANKHCASFHKKMLGEPTRKTLVDAMFYVFLADT
jgi:hypothetical protein